ncbi:ABC transporter ATP-binding protein [Rhodopseudomonas palustris]|uniref:ABC transporter ATP-binding protein n=1 Tax=Rhodopseudomonas palustris TaxID=1076 RepID=A0A323UDU6_RHOPL|nr:ABC transporter ATP-binding protein [Rhodopseudomonas palustris]PZA10377.1 ABC transporter ATP-binding protein [Rhodopseudomonas palustris]
MAPLPDSDPREPSPLFQGRGLTKRFGRFVANEAIDLDIAAGEIHALLGENGAGKSTLVKLITGLLQPDDGQMRWRGTAVTFAGPAQARACGIAAVSQHFALFDNLTVAENVALGLDRRVSVGKLAAELEQISRRYGLPLDPKREVWRLSVGERQRIEIVRALLQDPQLLILDEPTAVLTPAEAGRLFEVLERLKADGRALLYISHKLDEVKRLAGIATILRAGRVVGRCDPRRETAAALARMMVGSDVIAPKQSRHAIGAPLLSVAKLTLSPDDPHGVTLRDLSLEVRSGEIVGIAGVAGNGQDELFATLSGETSIAQADAITMAGEAVGGLSINRRRRLGAAFVPEQRLGHATVPTMSLSDNALLSGHATGGLVRYGLIDRGATRALVDRVTEAFDVRKASRDPEAARLSGGNLQKFIVGREILRQPKLLIVDQPSWGLDAGAASAIRQALLDLAACGAAVLVISQDLDELIEIADRIAVMFRGRLSPPRPVSEIGRDQLGLLMGGSVWPTTEAHDGAGA